MLLLLSIALFALVLAVPAIPTIREIYWPRDDGRLHIHEQYVRDPRWFGRSYREMLAAFVAAARGDAAYDRDVRLRTDEETRWEPDTTIPAQERLRGIAVGERIRVGTGAGIRDAYALESLEVERAVVARTLTSDGPLVVGDAVTILRWIDADGEISVGSGTDLGVSASGGRRVTLAGSVRFERVWGKPVVSRTSATDPFALRDRSRIVRIGRTRPKDTAPIVIHGGVRLAGGTHIPSHIKVHGSLDVEPGVHVAGNVIVRGDATFAANATVDGHVFAEGDIRLGPGCRVGRPGGVKTVYAAGRVLIAGDVEVQGWIVAEGGGYTL